MVDLYQQQKTKVRCAELEYKLYVMMLQISDTKGKLNRITLNMWAINYLMFAKRLHRHCVVMNKKLNNR